MDVRNNQSALIIDANLKALLGDEANYNKKFASDYAVTGEAVKEKIRQIYRYCKATVYTEHTKTARDVFSKRQGDCSGIASAFYVLCKASSPMHELSPEIRKLMTMMEADASWAEAFNLANPNELDVAQVILILQQKGKHGFGAVMIDKPWMGMKPKMVDDLDPMRGDPQMTENVDDILERVTEVCMHGIYRRLRLMGARMDCKNLSDVLLTMIDAQTIMDMDEESKVEMKGEALYDYRGRPIKYGVRTKAKQHRTPDSLANDQRIKQQTIVFDDFDRETADNEVKLNDWEDEQHDTR